MEIRSVFGVEQRHGCCLRQCDSVSPNAVVLIRQPRRTPRYKQMLKIMPDVSVCERQQPWQWGRGSQPPTTAPGRPLTPGTCLDLKRPWRLGNRRDSTRDQDPHRFQSHRLLSWRVRAGIGEMMKAWVGRDQRGRNVVVFRDSSLSAIRSRLSNIKVIKGQIHAHTSMPRAALKNERNNLNSGVRVCFWHEASGEAQTRNYIYVRRKRRSAQKPLLTAAVRRGQLWLLMHLQPLRHYGI